jgi:hypothetical protein
VQAVVPDVEGPLALDLELSAGSLGATNGYHAVISSSSAPDAIIEVAPSRQEATP